MIIKESSYSVVIVGKWNRSILNPAWIAANLFENSDDVQVEFSINFDMPARYKIRNILIAPSDEKVIFSSMDNSDESLTLIESSVIKLCESLQHTPFVAVGVNFGYLESKNKQNLLDLLPSYDEDGLSTNGWIISQRSIRRVLTMDIFNLNLLITMDENSDFIFDFNYHYLASNVTQIVDKIRNRILDYKNNSIELMNSIYSLNLTQDEL